MMSTPEVFPREVSHGRSDNAEILELPGVFAVQVFGEEFAALLERRPIAVLPYHFAKIRLRDIQHKVVVELFGFDDAEAWIFYRVHHPGERCDGYLERGGVVVGYKPPRLLYGEIAAVPVGLLLVPHEKDTKLIDARGNLIHDKALLFLLIAIFSCHFVKREYCGIARMVRIVARGAIDDFSIFLYGEIIRGAYRFIVRDDESVERSFAWRPAAHAHGKARAIHVDSRHAAKGVPFAALWQ